MMIDIHTHILPNIDDGAPDVSTSIEMLRAQQSQGVRDVFLTPHFYCHQYSSVDQFIDARRESFESLNEAVRNYPGRLPNLHLGAEVRIETALLELDSLDSLTLGKTGRILIEMPFEHWSDWMYEALFIFQSKHNVKPIIAHLDRYFGMVPDKYIEKLLDMNYSVQLNADTFEHKGLLRHLKAYFKYNPELFRFIGSDCHNMTTRVPNVGDNRKAMLGFFGKEHMGYMEKCAETLLKMDE